MNGFQLKIIAKAIKKSHLLNDWESDFIESLDSYSPDEVLTKNENHKLNEISQKVY